MSPGPPAFFDKKRYNRLTRLRRRCKLELDMPAEPKESSWARMDD